MRLHAQCLQHVQQQLMQLREAMDALKESLESEEKSSAGDKYETGRAMIQLEQEKLGHQQHELTAVLNALQRLPLEATDVIKPGALVKTTHGYFFLASGLGAQPVDTITVMVIAPAAPLAQALQSKRVGDHVAMGKIRHEVLAIT